MRYSADVREASRRRAELTGEQDSIEETRPILDEVQTDIWNTFKRLSRDRQTGMGPNPISAISIYQLCEASGYRAEDFLEPITALDDLWLEWYSEEQKKNG